MNAQDILNPSQAQTLVKSTRVSRKRVEDLQKYIAKQPQIDGMTTTHFFAGGMYCRHMFIPKDSLIVSKVHKTEHHFIGAVGRLHVWGQGDHYVLEPGGVVVSSIGTKRIVYAETDCIVMTIHKTDLTDVDAMEKELMEEDQTALYDAHNRPKDGVLTQIMKELES